MSPESQKTKPSPTIITAVAVGAIVAIGGGIRARNGIPVREVNDLEMSGLMEDYLEVLCQAQAIQAAALSTSEEGRVLIADQALAASRRRSAGEVVVHYSDRVEKNLESENAHMLQESASMLQESAPYFVETVTDEIALMLAGDLMPPQALRNEIHQTRRRADEIIRDQGRIPTKITKCNPGAVATRSHDGQWEVKNPTHDRTGVERKYFAFGRDRIDFRTAMRGRQ